MCVCVCASANVRDCVVVVFACVWSVTLSLFSLPWVGPAHLSPMTSNLSCVGLARAFCVVLATLVYVCVCASQERDAIKNCQKQQTKETEARARAIRSNGAQTRRLDKLLSYAMPTEAYYQMHGNDKKSNLDVRR